MHKCTTSGLAARYDVKEEQHAQAHARTASTRSRKLQLDDNRGEHQTLFNAISLLKPPPRLYATLHTHSIDQHMTRGDWAVHAHHPCK